MPLLCPSAASVKARRGLHLTGHSKGKRIRRIAAAVAATLGCGLVVGAGVAMAAPEWGITMTHANAYGLQAGECPSGHEE
jgi:hypothetical protein